MTTMEAADEQEHDADDAHAGRQLQDADLTDVQPTRQQRSLMERQQRVQRLVGSYKWVVWHPACARTVALKFRVPH